MQISGLSGLLRPCVKMARVLQKTDRTERRSVRMVSLFREEKDSAVTGQRVLFQAGGIVDITYLNAWLRGDRKSSLSPCVVLAYPDGMIQVRSDDGKMETLEQFPAAQIIEVRKDLGDPMNEAEISLILAEKVLHFYFTTREVKNSFWEYLVTSNETLRQQEDSEPWQSECHINGPYRQYTGVRCCTTGYFCYSFRDQQEEVFRVGSPVLPRPDVFLKGFGKELWCRKVDPEITRIPGVRRNVTDDQDQYYGCYIWSSVESMYMQIGDRQLYIMTGEHGWVFYSASEEVARITRIPKSRRTRGREKGFDTETTFDVKIGNRLPESLYPLIFGTPMLCF